MDNFSQISHQLKRDGYSQLDRVNKVLDPANVKVDGRETKDFLQFFYQYARQINFYETTSDQRVGDWIPLFKNSIPFQYAVIAAYDIDALEDRFEDTKKAIQGRLTFESLNLMFDLLFDIADQISIWLSDLNGDKSGLKNGIDNLIETNLSAQLLTLIQLANSAGKWNYKRAKNTKVLTELWGLNPITIYSVDRTILSLRGSQKHKVLDASAILEEIYRTFWKAIQSIVSIANDEKQLELSLTNEDAQTHEPHLGLMFTFLMLFKQVQGNLNSLSNAHLDFFYKKTLELKAQKIIPDQAHLTFELAKKVEEDILIEKGTRFKAGKDELGEDVFFELDEELIVTKTKVADLRTLYIDRYANDVYSEDIKNIEGLYMAPIANSADGLGEGFGKEQMPLWSTLGAKESKWTNPDEGVVVDQAFARLGFMLAAKVLFLREGTRKITIELTLNEDLEKSLNQNDLTKIFNISLTTEEGWLNIADHETAINLSNESIASAKLIKLVFTLPSDFPPVIAADSTLLEVDYGHQLPMIKAELKQIEGDNTAANCYEELRRKMVCKAQIDVQVCDVRQLVIQNDLSLLDINKPFMPFGPLPKKNSANFYIGSEEIFCKRWESIEVNPVWKDIPAEGFATYYNAYQNPPVNNEAFTAKLALLNDKIWTEDADDSPVELFTSGTSSLCNNTGVIWTVNQSPDNAKVCKDLSDIQLGYQANTPCGFLKLQLEGQDFLHDEYANTLIRNVGNFDRIPELKEMVDNWDGDIELVRTRIGQIDCDDDGNLLNVSNAQSSVTTADNNAGTIADLFQEIIDRDGEILLPNVPYTPLIESLKVNYEATASTDNEQDIFFTHLHPFESTYQHLPVIDSDPKDDDYETSVLPCFIDEGSLFIGLEDYVPGSNLNLYFQMEPASADPDVDKAVVCWEYLRNNQWKSLLVDTNILSDTTNGLIQSGIINFTIPSDISNEKTSILPANLHWLKARVLVRTAAISETLSVQTQSAKATFVPTDGNDLSRLNQSLGAGTIAKFETPVAAIKGLVQSYNGFGGRPEEAADVFNQRVSEYLRHKGRAISIFDYERIVLQAFKTIYKVKCISHTLGRRGESHDFELAPGFVTIVVIPDLNLLNANDPLEPKVPAATLNDIKLLLKNKTSPFINIEVLNPIFEKVSVQANVKFKAGKSNTFYANKLNEDVSSFLAPWAFSETRQDISFGGKIFYSTILKFIEDRSYVEYLVDFRMQDKDGNFKDVIFASNSRVVLTSGQHEFTVIESEEQLTTTGTSQKLGIGYSKIPEI